MSITDTIADALAPWMPTTTWHVAHPADDQRFHRALADAFSRAGCPLEPTESRDAMLRLLAEHHPQKQGYWTERIDQLVDRAEVIGHFLADTGGPRN